MDSAALNLGCVPVRASRSQRHSNPRSYLSPRAQEPVSPASKLSDGNSIDQNCNMSLLRSGSQSNLEKSTNGNSVSFVSGSNRHGEPKINNPTAPSFQKPYCAAYNQTALNKNNTSLNLGSVYPLYYGTNFQPQVSWLGVREPQISKDIIVGRPIFASAEKPVELGCMRSLLLRETNEIAPNKTMKADFREKNAGAPEMVCDLSLRLGLCSDSICRGKGLALATEKMDSDKHEGVKATAISSSREREFSLFPVQSANDPSGFCLASYNLEGEGQSTGALVRKRKLPFEGNVESRQFFWQVKPTSHHFADGMRKHNS